MFRTDQYLSVSQVQNQMKTIVNKRNRISTVQDPKAVTAAATTSRTNLSRKRGDRGSLHQIPKKISATTTMTPSNRPHRSRISKPIYKFDTSDSNDSDSDTSEVDEEDLRAVEQLKQLHLLNKQTYRQQ
ncbi:unnamed protein product [Didymodactylos carnosus]|uniref:Uncharacterized protein n=1 Tax=Didymodactylos carnosus TaxID=1234261 RepID=A0A814CZE9_9BILA|nr:unnamed protein product [Didymodactylos carnosus]CAF3722872.1 unnamed protein product [Didymodactylos carnosus]